MKDVKDTWLAPGAGADTPPSPSFLGLVCFPRIPKKHTELTMKALIRLIIIFYLSDFFFLFISRALHNVQVIVSKHLINVY